MKPVIFLVDMNAFYITCEMGRSPELWNRPAAVAGDPAKRTGIILAANYPARAHGVKTAMTVGDALRQCRELVCIPPDHDYYLERSHEVMDVLAQYTPVMEQNSIDEAWLDMTGTEALFGDPVTAAQRIMDDMQKHLSLWCSIGISENKFLAKMASDMQKPLGITTLWQEEVADKLWPLPINLMWGVGEKTSEKLNRLNIHTIGDLAHTEPHVLKVTLGDYAVALLKKAKGYDTSSLSPTHEHDIKSISRAITLAEDAHKIEDVYHVLLALAEDVGRRARRFSKKGTTVFVQLKFSDFSTITRQVTLPLPTCYTKGIFDAGLSLMKAHWPQRKGVRLLGIGLRNFENQCEKQLSIFDIESGKSTKSSCSDKEKIDEVMDQIRLKHGSDKIARASLMKKDDASRE